MTVADLFVEKPKRWGFRGDPYLWDALEQSFREIPLPCSEEIFREKLFLRIQAITGQRLELGKDIFVEKFSHGGLSSGGVSYNFWTNTAIPLLITRLEMANKELQNQYNYDEVVDPYKKELEQDCVNAHKHSSNHKEKLQKDKRCGCFYCLRIFSPQDIDQWLDIEGTAICPYCGVDSIIGESSGYPITHEFLLKMKKYWFY